MSNGAGAEKEKSTRENIYKKTVWNQAKPELTKMFTVERFNNLLAIGSKKYIPEEEKFDFKYDVAAYMKYEEVDLLIAAIEGAVVNAEYALKNDVKGVVYSATVDIPKKDSGYNGVSVDVKHDDGEIKFGVKIDNGTTADFMIFEGKYAAKLSVNKSLTEVEQNSTIIEFRAFGEAIKSYVSDSMRAQSFMKKMYENQKGGGNTNYSGKRSEAGEEYPF